MCVTWKRYLSPRTPSNSAFNICQAVIGEQKKVCNGAGLNLGVWVNFRPGKVI